MTKIFKCPYDDGFETDEQWNIKRHYKEQHKYVMQILKHGEIKLILENLRESILNPSNIVDILSKEDLDIDKIKKIYSSINTSTQYTIGITNVLISALDEFEKKFPSSGV